MENQSCVIDSSAITVDVFIGKPHRKFELVACVSRWSEIKYMFAAKERGRFDNTGYLTAPGRLRLESGGSSCSKPSSFTSRIFLVVTHAVALLARNVGANKPCCAYSASLIRFRMGTTFSALPLISSRYLYNASPCTSCACGIVLSLPLGRERLTTLSQGVHDVYALTQQLGVARSHRTFLNSISTREQGVSGHVHTSLEIILKHTSTNGRRCVGHLPPQSAMLCKCRVK